MSLYESLITKQEKLSVIGLGYVGLPIAVAFAKKGINVVGFDLNDSKIIKYKNGIDPTNEVGNDIIQNSSVDFTSDEKKLNEVKFHIVAVPTPVNSDHTPDLTPIKGASELVGRNLSEGSIVVFESTVYPGVTEEVCVPILEKESGLKCGVDFNVGYSPERINPGDKVHRLDNITKIVSGNNNSTLRIIANVYEIVVDAGVYKAESIKVAEAAKVIENSQRDINIAFMNELSIIFNKMGIDTQSVLSAAETKWNFLKFYPGLVGGHCIGVDPYYLTYKAEQLGYHSQVILSGRRINDGMGKYIAEQLVKTMISAGQSFDNTRVGILGFTFKENCPDIRNTKIIDIIEELNEFGVKPIVTDPYADTNESRLLYNVKISPIEEIKECDALIVAVSHDEYKSLKLDQILEMYRNNDERRVLLDVKGIFNRDLCEQQGIKYWRL